MRNRILLLVSCMLGIQSFEAFSGPPATSDFIKIDQFGYRCTSKKVAVISDPINGYNSALSFNPSTGVNQYQVRRWSDDQVMFSGTLTAFSGGATHVQSGDRGWWFDFSSFTTPGSYYVFDVGNSVGSFRFDIGDAVYDEVLKHAIRTYYYQRVGFAKTATYAGANWVDGASHTQDANATNLAGNTPRDLSGGWYDAGDYNKYTTFTADVIPVLLEAYRENPTAFKDNYNIPESGNGVPDLLDEVKWEMDWLKRMQDATGNGGLYLKVGANNYNEVTPPSTDARQRYYYPECTSATITGALVFSIAALVYKNIPTYAAYGNDLQTRAINAWNRFATTTSNYTTFQTTCDDGTIKSGDADSDQAGQMETALAAAVYLYELTGGATYKTFFESRYTGIRPYSETYWNAYRASLSKAVLKYTELPGITPAVQTNILNNLNTDYASGDFYLNAWNGNVDLYRAPMPDWAYRWGSNSVKANAGMISLDKQKYLAANKQTHRDIAEGFVHYIHGVNPQNMVYLSNMNAYGAEKSANEFYHTWYSDGSQWDNAITSPKGPAPGYLTGGPNYWYVAEGGGNASITPPANQPHQKAYKDWNTQWNGSFAESSYSVTENGIYYQAKYINMLARIMDNPSCGLPTPLHITQAEVIAADQTVKLNWSTIPDPVINYFSILSSADGQHFVESAKVLAIPGQKNYLFTQTSESAQPYYKICQIDYSGEVFCTQVLSIMETSGAPRLFPNPAKDQCTIVWEPDMEVTTLRVSDLMGNLLQSYESESGQVVLSLHHLSAGAYLVQIQARNHRWNMLLHKE